jgi:cell division protein FtsB
MDAEDLEDSFETTDAISNFAAQIAGDAPSPTVCTSCLFAVSTCADTPISLCAQKGDGTIRNFPTALSGDAVLEYVKDSRAALAEQVEKLQADLLTSQSKLHQLESRHSILGDKGEEDDALAAVKKEGSSARSGALGRVQARLQATTGAEGREPGRASTLLGMSARVLEELELEVQQAASASPRRSMGEGGGKQGGRTASSSADGVGAGQDRRPTPRSSSAGDLHAALVGGGDADRATEAISGSDDREAERLREELTETLDDLRESDVMIDGLIATNQSLAEELGKLKESNSSSAAQARENQQLTATVHALESSLQGKTQDLQVSTTTTATTTNQNLRA